MRATEYKDGIKRIKAKIEVPMSELDVGNYVLSALTHNVVNLTQIQKLNKRELLQLAKNKTVRLTKPHLTSILVLNKRKTLL